MTVKKLWSFNKYSLKEQTNERITSNFYSILKKNVITHLIINKLYLFHVYIYMSIITNIYIYIYNFSKDLNLKIACISESAVQSAQHIYFCIAFIS